MWVRFQSVNQVFEGVNLFCSLRIVWFCSGSAACVLPAQKWEEERHMLQLVILLVQPICRFVGGPFLCVCVFLSIVAYKLCSKFVLRMCYVRYPVRIWNRWGILYIIYILLYIILYIYDNCFRYTVYRVMDIFLWPSMEEFVERCEPVCFWGVFELPIFCLAETCMNHQKPMYLY